MRLKNKDTNMQNNRALSSKLGKVRAKKIFIMGICILLVLVLSLGATAYILLQSMYDNMHIEGMDTSVNKNISYLREILEREGDYTGSDFTPEEVAEAKRGIILDTYEGMLSEEKNYSAICGLLDMDINAMEVGNNRQDMLDAGFTNEEIDYCVKAYRFGAPDIIKYYVYETFEDVTTTSPPETSEPPESNFGSGDETTVAPETTPPIIVDAPEAEPPALVGVTVKESDIYNVLVVGVDARDASFNGRSDTIMLVSINKASKRVILTSFPRDMMVYDPSYGADVKINSIYSRAGTIGASVGRLAVALQHNFGVTVHDYAVVNFSVFEKIVNIFGGVEVPLYYAEYRTMQQTLHPMNRLDETVVDEYFKGHETDQNFYIHVRLNGVQALVYARMRKVWNPVAQRNERSDDLFRNQRQQNVVWSLFRQLRSLDLEKINGVANTVLPLVATSLTFDDFVFKMVGYMDYDRYSIHTLSLPLYGTWRYETINGASCIVVADFARNKTYWRNFVYK